MKRCKILATLSLARDIYICPTDGYTKFHYHGVASKNPIMGAGACTHQHKTRHAAEACTKKGQ